MLYLVNHCRPNWICSVVSLVRQHLCKQQMSTLRTQKDLEQQTVQAQNYLWVSWLQLRHTKCSSNTQIPSSQIIVCSANWCLQSSCWMIGRKMNHLDCMADDRVQAFRWNFLATTSPNCLCSTTAIYDSFSAMWSQNSATLFDQVHTHKQIECNHDSSWLLNLLTMQGQDGLQFMADPVLSAIARNGLQQENGSAQYRRTLLGKLRLLKGDELINLSPQVENEPAGKSQK